MKCRIGAKVVKLAQECNESIFLLKKYKKKPKLLKYNDNLLKIRQSMHKIHGKIALLWRLHHQT